MLRIASLSGRAALVGDGLALDVERASGGRFSSDPQAVYERWDEFTAWAAAQDLSAGVLFRPSELGPPVPHPRQIFAIGLNYASHAGESGFAVPTDPVVFTKYASSLAGAETTVVLGGPRVDWEAELVAVIGQGGRAITRDDAWSHVAGLTVGQDLSDRTVQFWGNPPQFNLGKSLAGFAPVGPWVVAVDGLARDHDRNDLGIRCTLVELDGTTRVLQNGRTRDMVFTIPVLIERLSAIVELYPGDIIFTGTPEGVGIGRDPQEFLKAGQTLITEIEGIGAIRQRFVAY